MSQSKNHKAVSVSFNNKVRGSGSKVWRISEAFDARQTDGILELELQNEFSAPQLWEAVKTSSNSKKGVAASIFHALLASSSSADAALDLYELACNKKGSGVQIEPDLITFCLLADVLRTENIDPEKDANAFLELARRNSDKTIPGNRTERAAARRRQRLASFHNAESKLKELLGQDFSVLFENNSFAIINKPAGISCTAQPSKKQVMDLSKALIYTIEPISSINRGLVHRLDKDTSGCMIMPKTNGAHAMFLRQFFLRRIDKTYECIVEPGPPIEDSGIISIPVDSRPAESVYKVLQRYSETGRTLLEITTRTGRKHQVRVHCSQGLLCPIVGDSQYNLKKPTTRKDHLYLHASKLLFSAFGEQVAVQAPCPSFWQQ